MVAGSVELVVVVLQLMHGGGILALLDLLVETSLERCHRSSEASELFFELLLSMGDGWLRSKLGEMGGWVFGSPGVRLVRCGRALRRRDATRANGVSSWGRLPCSMYRQYDEILTMKVLHRRWKEARDRREMPRARRCQALGLGLGEAAVAPERWRPWLRGPRYCESV